MKLTMKQTREALALLSIVDMMHVEGLAAGTINENAARIAYKVQGCRPVRYIHINSRAQKANLDAIAAAVAEAIGEKRWTEIVAVVIDEETEAAQQPQEAPQEAPVAEAEQQPTETDAATMAPADAAQVWTEEGKTVATATEAATVAGIIRRQGGYRERDLLTHPHTMTCGETWNAEHKVIYVTEATNDLDGHRGGCAVDIVTRSIVG